MIEQFRNDLEQRLSQLKSTAQSASLTEIANELESLYEQALVAELIETRNTKKSALFERVENAVANSPAPEPTFTEPHAEAPPATKPPVEAANPFPLNPEIKVVPVPEGPPMPVNHASPTEEIDVIAQPKAPVEPVTPPKAVEKPAPPVAKQTPEAPPKPAASIAEKAQQSQKQTSLHQRLAAKNLSFGLNDRIAYIKHLFDGSAEDFNRVVNQINTFENWVEAEEFIAEMVKPDYNWEGKEQYEERFVGQIRVRFEA